MPDDLIPRLFVLRSGSLDGPVVADGVQWPDGTITVRRHDPAATASWSGWDDPAAIEVQDGTSVVVWRRRDTYIDPPAAEPATNAGTET